MSIQDNPFHALLTMGALMGGGREDSTLVPIDDSTDVLTHNLDHVPSDVTMCRRAGHRVVFHEDKMAWCMPNSTWIPYKSNNPLPKGSKLWRDNRDESLLKRGENYYPRSSEYDGE